MNMTMEQIKMQYRIGNVKTYFFQRDVNKFGGWLVYFVLTSAPDERVYLLDSRRKEKRIFQSLDGAVSAVESVGFTVEKIRTVTDE